MSNSTAASPWPALPYSEWSDTCKTLHLWTQIVGKVRLALAPHVNHWWQVPLYVTARGVTTSPMPYMDHALQIDFDFIDHQLIIDVSDGRRATMQLEPMSVAAFYEAFMGQLDALDIHVDIWPVPVELPDPIPFKDDTQHASYDAEYAHRFWRILVQTDRVLTQFRSRFTGKVSPVHFFWGSFDLAVTRFSGREAPEHPGIPGMPDWITREAYSHECSSCGLWPGGNGIESPMFYAYAYPEPDGFRDYPVKPNEAFYSDEMREFFLSYDVVREANSPDEMLLDFLQSTYAAAAVSGSWDRKDMERAGVVKHRMTPR